MAQTMPPVRQHPGYRDPDILYAEHMIKASYHMQQAGLADLAEKCAEEAMKAFDGVPYDKKARCRKLGRASWWPAGILRCESDERYVAYISIAAAPYNVNDDGQSAVDAIAKKDMLQFMTDRARSLGLGWFAAGQIRAVLNGRKFKPKGPHLAAVLSELSNIITAWRMSDNDPVIAAACREKLAKILERRPMAGTSQAESWTGGGYRSYNDHRYALYWLPAEFLDEIRERSDACMQSKNILSSILDTAYDKTLQARWPLWPDEYETGDIWGVDAISKKMPGHQYLMTSPVNDAIHQGHRVWALCQAYAAISQIPDESSIKLFQDIGILPKSLDFAPPDLMWHDVMLLSLDKAIEDYQNPNAWRNQYLKHEDRIQVVPYMQKARDQIAAMRNDQKMISAYAFKPVEHNIPIEAVETTPSA